MDRVKFRTFRGTTWSWKGLLKRAGRRGQNWQRLFEEAALFASELGRERLINISHSEDTNDGVVTIWYWDR